jgi:hypothetical protein
MNHSNPFELRLGELALSVFSLVLIIEMIYGLIKQRNRVADECIPSVLLKESMVNPVKKPKISNNQPGVLKGNKIMNRI